MLTNLLLFLILFILLVFLWRGWQKEGLDVNAGADELLPDFPIDRPVSDYREAPRQDVSLGVERDAEGRPVRIRLSDPDLQLDESRQIAWQSREGKVEIRFSPPQSPFTGASFIAAKGGTALSGLPRPEAVRDTPQPYLVLLITAEGTLLREQASVTVVAKLKRE